MTEASDLRDDLIADGIKAAKDLGVEQDVLQSLMSERPSFQTITAHAIWESTTKDAIESTTLALSFDDAFDQARLSKFFQRMGLNGNTGAMELFRCVYDVPEIFVAHLRRLTELRNKFAHGHKHLGWSYSQMLADKEEAEKRQFVVDFVPVEPAGIPKQISDGELDRLMSSAVSLMLFRYVGFCSLIKQRATKAGAFRKQQLVARGAG